MGTALIVILLTLFVCVNIVHHLARIAPLEHNDVTAEAE
jgi:hypothetical protein